VAHSPAVPGNRILETSGRTNLAKGDKRRSNREIKKPKQDKPKPAATPTTVSGIAKTAAGQKRPKSA
jgi:hypothetical protein